MPVSRHPLSSGLPAWTAVKIDPKAAERLQVSLNQMLTRAPDLARAFYARLFARYPTLRPMFRADTSEQERKLIDSLKFIIGHIREDAVVRQALHAMGARHAGYGVKPEHYPLVIASLLESMQEAMGELWTTDLATEWSQALNLVSLQMIDGAGYPRSHEAHVTKTAHDSRSGFTRHADPTRT
jgi:nitric oxide dioxygenase